jgi:hypothetical protein
VLGGGSLTFKHIVERLKAADYCYRQQAPMAKGWGEMVAVLRVQLGIARHGPMRMFARSCIGRRSVWLECECVEDVVVMLSSRSVVAVKCRGVTRYCRRRGGPGRCAEAEAPPLTPVPDIPRFGTTARHSCPRVLKYCFLFAMHGKQPEVMSSCATPAFLCRARAKCKVPYACLSVI